MVCAATVLASWADARVRDSKDLSKRQREFLADEVLLYPTILKDCLLEHSSQTIDAIGLVMARNDLVVKVVAQCMKLYPSALVVMDGNVLPAGLPPNSVCFPKADKLVPAVSAASVIAKVYRDRYMQYMHGHYPQYGFDSNAGYHSAQHMEALRAMGLCPIHRKSYKNLKPMTAVP